MTTTPTKSQSIGLMLGSVVLFAANALLIRGLSLYAPAVDGWVASLFRGAVGIVIVVTFFGFGRGFQLSHLITNRLLFIRGILGGFGILALYMTVVHLGAARAIIINLSYPIFGSLIATIWLKERLSVSAWIWMIIGFLGLMLFMGSDLEAGIGIYDWIAVGGAIAAGAVVAMIRQLRHTEHTSSIYAAQCVASGMIALVPAAQPTASLSPSAFWLMILAGVIVAAAQLAMTHSYRTLSVAQGGAIQMLLPLVTTLGGWLLFDETFTTIGMVGAVITLLATWRVIVSPARRTRLASTPQSA